MNIFEWIYNYVTPRLVMEIIVVMHLVRYHLSVEYEQVETNFRSLVVAFLLLFSIIMLEQLNEIKKIPSNCLQIPKIEKSI